MMAFHKEQQSKRKAVIMTVVTVAVLAVGLFFFLGTQVFNTKNLNIYQLDLGSEKDTDVTRQLYLENEKSMSPRVTYGTRIYRETLDDQPATVVLSLPAAGALPVNATIAIELANKNSDAYLDGSLIFPGITNYEIVKEYSDVYLYKRKNISTVKDFDDSSVTDFIIKNYYGSSIYTFYNIGDQFQHIDSYSREKTKISSTFRGNLKMAVYVIGDLTMSFSKRDLNDYEGLDEYTLTIKDLNNNIVYSKKLPDDGVKVKDSRLGIQENYTISTPALSGVYYVEFIKDGQGEADSTISNIEVDSNKIVLRGDFLVLDPIDLYMRNSAPRKIGFKYWHRDKWQEINIRDSQERTTVINLTEAYKGVNYWHNLSVGEHEISINKSYLWVLTDFTYSPKKENWFEVPLKIEKELNNPEFIIIDKNRITLKKNSIVIKKPIVLTNSTTRFNIASGTDSQLKIMNVKIVI